MGLGNSVTLNVNYDRATDLYYAGEKITGWVAVNNSSKTLKFKSICLQFIGEIDYRQSDFYEYYDGVSQPFHGYHVVRNRKSFINIRCPIVHPTENEDLIKLHHGQHSWPFEFHLPQLLPPSSSPTNVSHPCIRYYTRILVNKSWRQRDLMQMYPLIIFPNVNIFPYEIRRQPLPQSCAHRESLHMNVSLQHRAILASQTLSVHIDLNNPEHLRINKFLLKFIQHRVIDTDHHKEILLEKDLLGLLDFSQTHLNQTFHLELPFTHLSPTFNCKIKRRTSLISTNVYYEIKLEAKVHGMSDNIDISMPIIIGTESSAEQDDQSADIPISYSDAMTELELPPDYQSAMRKLALE
ncbi:unnamed protein product [Adineta ricciae]|uniref:Arrestin C-terminal-like domain-containing protein n=1 Tax=Adineta ricciae TaxID=249248 RepID=A0A815PK46_ADIRI|nr:unnamed protein product [Adineta ricciae]